MPRFVDGKIVASGPGMPASSAQADKAQAGSAQADSERPMLVSGFNLRFASDAEYNQSYQSSITSRMSSVVPRPMPDIIVNADDIPVVVLGPNKGRPVAKLPKSNLTEVTAPPGMNYNDSYQWQLAMLLEAVEDCSRAFQQ